MYLSFVLLSMSSKGQQVLSLFEREMNTSVEEIVEDWKIDNALVENLLKDSVTQSQKEYLEEQLGTNKLAHNMDNRTPVKYGAFLVRNWLLEDIVSDILSSDADISVKKSGKDSQREFLDSPNADPDLNITLGGSTYYIEVIADYDNFWQPVGKIDLRDEKYPNLQNKENGILLGIDFKNNDVLTGYPMRMEASYTESHDPYGGKQAYRVDASTVTFSDFSNLSMEVKKTALILE